MMVFQYSDANGLDELPQVLVHTFDMITDLLREGRNTWFVHFDTWWMLYEQMGKDWSS